MNRVKLLFLVVTFILLCGCSAKYQVIIDEEFMKEEMTIILPNTSKNKEKLEENLKIKQSSYYDIDRRETKYYTKKLEEDDNYLYLKYSYNYVDDNLGKSSLIDYCFYKKSIIKNDNIVTINTSSGASCFYKDEKKQLDKLTVEIITDKYVIENNADEVKDNKYIWNYNLSNFEQKTINIKIDLDKEAKEEISNLKLFIIMTVVILSIITFISLNVYIKHKKNNRG